MDLKGRLGILVSWNRGGENGLDFWCKEWSFYCFELMAAGKAHTLLLRSWNLWVNPVAISCEKKHSCVEKKHWSWEYQKKLNQKNTPLSLLIIFALNYMVINFSVCERASEVKVCVWSLFLQLAVVGKLFTRGVLRRSQILKWLFWGLCRFVFLW